MENHSKFYTSFPTFDWKFYTTQYADIVNAGIVTEDGAIQHYTNHGKNEGRRTHQIIPEKTQQMTDVTPINASSIIKIASQCVVSSGLQMFRDRIFNKYNLTAYANSADPCIFFGIYTDNDIFAVKNHIGLKIVIWGGEDANTQNTHSLATVKELKRLPNTIHLAISKCIFDHLRKQHIQTVLIDFNLVDTKLFQPIPPSNASGAVSNKTKMIFIFNGQTPGRTHIYGEKYYLQVMRKLPQFKYLFSNSLNAPHSSMPSIYCQCFVMLRLTENDGNANSVQECEAMNIPAIHNQSEYGLKWTTVDDIVSHILSIYNNSRDGVQPGK